MLHGAIVIKIALFPPVQCSHRKKPQTLVLVALSSPCAARLFCQLQLHTQSLLSNKCLAWLGLPWTDQPHHTCPVSPRNI